jgi:hypothetical protein
MFTAKRNIGDPDMILFIVLIVWNRKQCNYLRKCITKVYIFVPNHIQCKHIPDLLVELIMNAALPMTRVMVE